MTTQLTIVPGSLLDSAQKNHHSLAESFLSCDALVIVDSSGSMATNDAPNNRRRHDAARDELRRIQATLPGRIGIIVFSSTVQFVPGGDYPELNGGTNLTEALRFVKVADDCGIHLIVVSDGEPNDETTALQVARTFKSHIDAIYIGPEAGRGRDFLCRLSEATGGRFVQSDAIAQLADPVLRLMGG